MRNRKEERKTRKEDNWMRRKRKEKRGDMRKK